MRVSAIPEHIRIGARAGGSVDNAFEAANSSKPVHVESLDRPVRIDEENGDHAVMAVNVQLSGHRRTPAPVAGVSPFPNSI